MTKILNQRALCWINWWRKFDISTHWGHCSVITEKEDLTLQQDGWNWKYSHRRTNTACSLTDVEVRYLYIWGCRCGKMRYQVPTCSRMNTVPSRVLYHVSWLGLPATYYILRNGREGLLGSRHRKLGRPLFWYNQYKSGICVESEYYMLHYLHASKNLENWNIFLLFPSLVLHWKMNF